jgi:hypothetical protein
MRVFNVADELLGRDPEEYCLSWDPNDNTMEPTVFCPLCGMDSVLGDASGLPVEDPAFLKGMHTRWFETAKTRAAAAATSVNETT